MSKDIIMIKRADGTLAPADSMGVEYIQKMPVGKALGVTITQARNYKFHQKIICLLEHLYNVLPKARATYRGQELEQSFATFRREMIALCGHYRADATMQGTLRIEPQSLKYSECSEELAQIIYSDLIDKALQLLGTDMDRDGIDEMVNSILRFDS